MWQISQSRVRQHGGQIDLPVGGCVCQGYGPTGLQSYEQGAVSVRTVVVVQIAFVVVVARAANHGS